MPEIEHNPTEKRSLNPVWAALALILFGVVMAAWHLLLTGISDDFGAGAVVGFLIGSGVIFLLSKTARSLP